MLLFSIKRGNISEAMNNVQNLPKDVEFAVYFIIFRIVVLEEAAEQFNADPSQEGFVEYVEMAVDAEVEKAEKDERENEELQENFL